MTFEKGAEEWNFGKKGYLVDGTADLFVD